MICLLLNAETNTVNYKFHAQNVIAAKSRLFRIRKTCQVMCGFRKHSVSENILGYFRGFLAIAGPRNVPISGQIDRMQSHY